MKVKAKFPNGKFGFYGDRRRRDGDEFEIDPKFFSEKWMIKLDEVSRRDRKPKDEAETEDGGE